MSPKGGIKPHKRFSIQAKRSEVLFVDYMAEHLTPQGRAGIIVPEGIIFQSQTAYKALRKLLVENSLVAVVSLPAGCFNPYSGVKTSILILDKSLAKQSDTVLDHYRPHISIHPDWPMVPLGDHFSTSSGGTPSKEEASYWIGDIDQYFP